MYERDSHPTSPLRHCWNVARPILGWICIVIGFIGVIVPGPGIPFLVVGILLIGRRHPHVRNTFVTAKLRLRSWARQHGVRRWIGVHGKRIVHQIDAQIRQRSTRT